MYVIQINNLVKRYGKFIALNDISFNIKHNAITALLGPNGAGKTTFVKSLLGLVKINSGNLSINGKTPRLESSREGIAFLPEQFNFFPYYNVKNTLKFYAEMYAAPKDQIEEQINYALEKLNILFLKNNKIKNLSKGQLQRVGIATLLLGNNQIFILDEPFSGLDPLGIKELKNLIKQLKKDGKSIFLNSHILAEVEKIADDIIVLHQGKCLAQGSLTQIKGDNNLEDFFYKIISKDKNGNENEEDH